MRCPTCGEASLALGEQSLEAHIERTAHHAKETLEVRRVEVELVAELGHRALDDDLAGRAEPARDRGAMNGEHEADAVDVEAVDEVHAEEQALARRQAGERSAEGRVERAFVTRLDDLQLGVERREHVGFVRVGQGRVRLVLATAVRGDAQRDDTEPARERAATGVVADLRAAFFRRDEEALAHELFHVVDHRLGALDAGQEHGELRDVFRLERLERPRRFRGARAREVEIRRVDRLAERSVGEALREGRGVEVDRRPRRSPFLEHAANDRVSRFVHV